MNEKRYRRLRACLVIFAILCMMLPAAAFAEGEGTEIYTVTTDSAMNGGSVTVDPVSGAEGATITVAVTPDSGKELVEGSLKYTADEGATYTAVSVTDDVYSFTMPGADVAVTAQFGNIPEADVVVPAQFENIPLGEPATTLSTVYLNGASGDDTNDGASADTAVKTFAAAKALLSRDGVIYITGAVTLTDSQTWSLPAETYGNAKVMRNNGYTRWLVQINSGGDSDGDLTLDHITIDGGGFSTSYSSIQVNSKGHLTMNDGAVLQNGICSNSSRAPVYVNAGGSFTMNGGAIKDNTNTQTGGATGVYGATSAAAVSTVTINNGTIDGGTGVAIYYSVSGKPDNQGYLTISGSAVIKGAVASTGSVAPAPILISSQLTDSFNVSVAAMTEGLVIAKGTSGYTLTADALQKFTWNGDAAWQLAFDPIGKQVYLTQGATAGEGEQVVYFNPNTDISGDGSNSAQAVKTFADAKVVLDKDNYTSQVIYILNPVNIAADTSETWSLTDYPNAQIKRAPTLTGNLISVTGTLTLDHITIDGGNVPLYYGLIAVSAKGNLVMNEGAVLQNAVCSSASQGPAVTLYDNGSFTMNGGAIQNNSNTNEANASNCIYARASASAVSTMIINGGVIDGGSGTAIYYNGGSTIPKTQSYLTIGGGATIKGLISSIVSSQHAPILISSALTNSLTISETYATEGLVIAKGTADYNMTAGELQKFSWNGDAAWQLAFDPTGNQVYLTKGATVVEGEQVVYFNPNTDISGDGTNSAQAVKTFADAKALLNTADYSTQVIYILNTVNIDTGASETWSLAGYPNARLQRSSVHTDYLIYCRGTLTLDNIIIDGGNIPVANRSAINVYNKGNLIMNDGVVLQNNYLTSSSNAAVNISSGGNFTMNGGTIKDNTNTQTGKPNGIYSTGGAITINGGTIDGGAGVAIFYSGGSLTISGSGVIKGIISCPTSSPIVVASPLANSLTVSVAPDKAKEGLAMAQGSSDYTLTSDDIKKFAWGGEEPWTFALDPATGQMYLTKGAAVEGEQAIYLDPKVTASGDGTNALHPVKTLAEAKALLNAKDYATQVIYIMNTITVAAGDSETWSLKDFPNARLQRCPGLTSYLISVWGTLALDNITIDGGSAPVNSSAIQDVGNLILNGGAVLQNNICSYKETPAAVKIEGLFTMNGGAIKNNVNTVNNSYNGIYAIAISSSAETQITINGGAIDGGEGAAICQFVDTSVKNPGFMTIDSSAVIKGKVAIAEVAENTVLYTVVIPSPLKEPLTVSAKNVAEGRSIVRGTSDYALTTADCAKLAWGGEGTWYFVLDTSKNEIYLTADASASTKAGVPVITAQPQNVTALREAVRELSVTVNVEGRLGTLGYQWYRNDRAATEGGTAIDGATDSTYQPDTSVAGDVYYYVTISNTIVSGDVTDTASVTSEIAKVTVIDLTAKNIMPGVSGILGGGVNWVYYGKADFKNQQKQVVQSDYPVKWRVLAASGGNAVSGGAYKDADGAAVDGSKAMLLLSEYLIERSVFGGDNTYETSTVHTWLTNYYNNTAYLSSAEKAGILSTTTSQDNSGTVIPAGTFDAYGSRLLDNEKLFLLSGEEAVNSGYGFSPDPDANASVSGRRGAYLDTDSSATGMMWWLRTPATNTQIQPDSRVISVVMGGSQISTSIVDQDKNEGVGIRPAFNLNLSNVLFSSNIADGKTSGAPGADALTRVVTGEPAEWKLTMLDSGRSGFAVAEKTATATVNQGLALNLNYSGAVSGDKEYVSALLTDNSGDVLYYGKLKAIQNSEDASGTLTVNLPSDLAVGNYNLQLFSEQCNDGARTDYASPFQTVAVTVAAEQEIQTPPALTASSATVGQQAVLTFPDDEAWRTAVSSVSVDGTTLESGQYTIAAGTITIDKSVFAGAKDYSIVVQATGYSDAAVTQTMQAPGGKPAYKVTPAEDGAYTIGATPDGIKTMTVNTGHSGLKYFAAGISPVTEHSGEETAVFVHLRNDVLIEMNASRTDFDLVPEAAAGFNVKAGDVVKVYLVDALTNAIDSNPVVLQ